MTLDGISRIEAALGITLPSAYKALVTNYPPELFQHAADFDLMDDPDRVIAMNREVTWNLSMNESALSSEMANQSPDRTAASPGVCRCARVFESHFICRGFPVVGGCRSADC